ncbi:hypothetical protein BaRGS_00022445 [Batillaria attramentaria]|uniref:General transcription factor IIF subunit 2 n=1 Tax=Batillaria attramentaria TaxID=370345 RepID=A0ABD0KH15_9CAEN
MQNIEKGHEAKDVDVTAAGRGVWLVKVPKYLAERWEDAEGTDVGVMRITRSKGSGQKPDVIFTSSDSVMANSKAKSVSVIPRQHKFALTGVGNQNLTVFSKPQTGGQDRIAIEGKVMQRAECLPIADDSYMKLKRNQLEINNKPKREIVLLQSVVPTYKPRSDHIANKHQYYNVKDLVGITKQPIPYLKEILQEICVYNMKAPHKNMWELKPEYRHYRQQDGGT